METLPTDWNTYVGRRRLNLTTWLPAKGIKNYDELVKFCRANMIVPPEESQVKDHFVKPKKVVDTAPKKTPKKPVVDAVVESKVEEKSTKMEDKSKAEEKIKEEDSDDKKTKGRKKKSSKSAQSGD